MTESVVNVPPASSVLWTDLAAGRKKGQWSTLPVKIMMTRIQTQIESDSTPANISVRAKEIHAFFEKNAKIVEKDLRALVQ